MNEDASGYRENGAMETVPCALCGGTDHAKVFDARDVKHGVPGLHTFVRCRGCGLVFLNPRFRKEFLGKLYPDEYEPHLSHVGDAVQRAAREGMQAARYRLLKKTRKYPGILLDVGSGAGDFISYVEARGWSAHGIEPNEAAYLEQKKLGMKVYREELTDIAFGADFFDAVTFWDTFEHIHNPLETLTETMRILKGGGAVIVSLPNFGSVERILFGAKWFGLDTPRHLYHYTPRTLRLTLEKAGFAEVSIVHSTTATCFVNSMKIILGGKDSPGAAETKAPFGTGAAEHAGFRNAVKRAVFFGALVPLLQTLDKLRLGGHIIAVAAKPAPPPMDFHTSNRQPVERKKSL